MTAGRWGAAARQTGWRRRLRQGIQSLLVPLRTLDLAPARALLSEAEFALFRRMQRGEQLHALAVLATVRAQANETPRPLAQAALLHDIGKTRYPLTLFGRSWAALIRDLWPALAARWAAEEPDRYWRRALCVMYQHASWGAELAAAAGVDERVCWLIAAHHDPPASCPADEDGRLLRRLQAADSQH